MGTRKSIGAEIAAQLDAIIKVRGSLQVICDKLDDKYAETGDRRTGVQLTAVQGCIDLLRDAEKELYLT